MGSLSTVADQLRTVRRARRQFLKMWAIDHALVEPALDRVAHDLDVAQTSSDPRHPSLNGYMDRRFEHHD